MLLKNFIKTLFFLSVLCIAGESQAVSQDLKKTASKNNKKPVKEKLHITADMLEGGESKNEDGTYKQLIGNVQVVHKDFVFKSDIATLFDKKHYLESTGHIKVTGKDNLVATAGKIIYKTKEKIAYITSNVRCKQNNIEFETEDLEYHVDNKQFVYKKGGTLKEKGMVITSVKGLANVDKKLITLTEEVAADIDDYALDCEWLSYDQKKEIVRFNNDVQLTIKKNNNYLTTPVEGLYDKKNKKLFLKEGIYHSEKSLAYAKEIIIDQDKNCIKADGNIEIKTKNKDVFTFQHLFYDNKHKIGHFTGKPLLQKNNSKNEKFYLIADRFELLPGSIPNTERNYDVFDDDEEEDDKEESIKNNNSNPFIIKAIDNISMYSEGFQGKSKNLTYDSKTGRIIFEGDSIFWSKNSQLTGEDVEMRIKNDDIDRLDIFKNAFMVIKDDVGFYNQSKGKSMHIRFFDGEMDDLVLKDNVESLMFVTADKKFVGTNNVKCPKMTILMNDDFKPEKVVFLNRSSAIFQPKDYVDISSLLLPGFSWKLKEKPSLNIFKVRIPKKYNIPVNEPFREKYLSD